MSYSEIIKEHIKIALHKRQQFKSKYWEWVVQQLIADLLDYEGKGVWLKEQYDKAWRKYKSFLTVDDIIRMFFGEKYEVY